MEQRAVGVVAIIVKKRASGAPEVNEVLTEFGDIILGTDGTAPRGAGAEHHHPHRGRHHGPDRGAHRKARDDPRRHGQIHTGKGLKENSRHGSQQLSTPATGKAWKDTVIRQDEIDRYLIDGKDFIDDALIEALLAARRNPIARRVGAIISKSAKPSRRSCRRRPRHC